MEPKKVFSLVCGILYENSFSVMDDWGKICDGINNYPEFEGVFTKITDEVGYSKSITDDKGDRSITISFNNLIYSCAVDGLSDKSFNNFKNVMVSYFVPKVISEYNLITRRIGVVYSCKGSNEEVLQQVEKYYRGNAKEITDIRFSKKETTAEGLRELGKNDYINKIITIGGLSKEDQGISYDYQRHFNPLQPYIDKHIEKVLDNSLKAFQEDVFGNNTKSKRCVS